MQLHDFALILIAFGSETLGTLSGFGSSTFFVPSALLFESFKFVLALTAILHCFGNVFKILLFRRDFEWSVFLRLGLPSIAFTALGAILSNEFQSDLLIRALGFALMIFAVLSVVLKADSKQLPNWIAIFLAAVSGFSTGFVGTGGAIRGLALTAINLPKNSFVAVSSAIDIGGDFLRAGIYVQNGYMDWSQWFYIPLLALAALAGARLGKKILGRIHQDQFKKIVAGFIFLSGLTMLFGI